MPTSTRPPSSSARSVIDRSPTPGTRADRHAGAVVGHLGDHRVLVAAEPHRDVPGLAVAYGVGEGLADDEVPRQLDGRRQLAQVVGRGDDLAPGALEADGQLTHGAGQAELVQGRGAQVVHQAPHLGHDAVESGRQLREQLGGALRVLGHQVASQLGLERQTGDDGPDPVVQVATQPSPLLLTGRHGLPARGPGVAREHHRVHGYGGLLGQPAEQPALGRRPCAGIEDEGPDRAAGIGQREEVHLRGPDPPLHAALSGELHGDVRRPQQGGHALREDGEQPVRQIRGIGRRLQPVAEPGQGRARVVGLAVDPLVRPTADAVVHGQQHHGRDRGRDDGCPAAGSEQGDDGGVHRDDDDRQRRVAQPGRDDQVHLPQPGAQPRDHDGDRDRQHRQGGDHLVPGGGVAKAATKSSTARAPPTASHLSCWRASPRAARHRASREPNATTTAATLTAAADPTTSGLAAPSMPTGLVSPRTSNGASWRSYGVTAHSTA